MNPLAVVAMYLAMLVFDAALLGAAGWLIVVHGWSAWWVLVAVIVGTGSNPKYLIATASGNKAAEP